MSPQPPDLVVGIDLGTTYTGISYCIPKLGDLVEPPVINNWPGRENEVFNKVPTVVAFTGARVASWGFDAQLKRNDNRTKTEERFKLLLDKKILDEINKEVPVSMKEVENWFRAFLGELYDWISKQLEVHISDLQNMTVEYIFSVPATWEEETVERYLKVIKEAGFGSMDRHSVSIGLNEAEAAAVQTAIYNSNQETDGYKPGDVVLVCDAGGGTTDVCIMEVTGFRNNVPQFRQICRIDGAPVGSTNIDDAFNQLVESRLRLVPRPGPRRIRSQSGSPLADQPPAVESENSLNHLIEDVRHAASGNFQSFKANLGTDTVDILDNFTIKIPGLRENIDNSSARILEGGHMVFSRVDIEVLFDRFLSWIYKLIDNQLQLVQNNNTSAKVNYFILSGGLGSSKYVQRHLKKRYIRNRDRNYPVADGIKILIADNPQIVVCRGLVINRVHQIYNVEPMISHRCGRASYGFIFQELYDKTKDAHVRLKHKRIKLPTDRHYYLPDRIRWFIDRDAPVHCSQFLISKFSRTLDSKNPGKLEHKIIKFDGELQDRRDDRQDELGSDFGTLVGTVSYELEPNIKSNMRNIQKKHRHNLFVKWGPYLHVDYAIRVRVDSASMKFELDIGEEKKSRVETVEVHWTKELNKVVAKNQEIENAREGDGQSST